MITSQSCESWKITIEIHTYKVVPNKSLAQLVIYAKYIYNVVNKLYKKPSVLGWFIPPIYPFMVNLGMVYYCFNHITYLVGGIPTPLKHMSSSVGVMKFPIYGKS